MEIESYEPYHIGNKLNPAMNFDSLSMKLKEELKTNGYSVPEKTFSVGLNLVFVEILGTKDGTRVELNYLAQALNVVGARPERVTEIFAEVSSILQNLGYETGTTTLFYEIITSIVIRTNGRPVDILNRSSSLDLGHLSVDEMNMNIIGLKIGGENPEKGKLFTLSIEPNVTSPNSRLLVRLHYKSREKPDIELFNRDLNTKIVGLINQMEKDNVQ